MMEIQEIEEMLQQKQNPHRYRHTIGVRYTSICLAMRYGEDLTKASYAGLLHDCAKHMSGEKLLEKCRSHHLPVSDVEAKNPFLLHGRVGAWLARHRYGVEDPEMTLLEKIVFTADYIEPGRDQAPNLAWLRQLAFTDIDQAVCEILKQTLDYLRDQGGEIDPATEVTYSYYLQKCAENTEG